MSMSFQVEFTPTQQCLTTKKFTGRCIETVVVTSANQVGEAIFLILLVC